MQTENETPFVNDDIVVDSTNKPNRNHEVICVLMSAMIVQYISIHLTIYYLTYDNNMFIVSVVI